MYAVSKVEIPATFIALKIPVFALIPFVTTKSEEKPTNPSTVKLCPIPALLTTFNPSLN